MQQRLELARQTLFWEWMDPDVVMGLQFKVR
jgi:hypothetical protein